MSVNERSARAELAFPKFLIPHPRVAEIAQQIDIMRAVGRGAREEWEGRGGIGLRPEHKFLAILAESHSGKSTAVRAYVENMLATEAQSPGHMPLIYVPLSEKATTARAASDILQALGDPDYEDGTGSKRIKRAGILAEEARTEVVIIDEMQHLINEQTPAKTATDVRDMLKLWLIKGTAPLIFVGTPAAEAVLMSDRQMPNRAYPPIYFPALDDGVKEDWATWIGHCAGFDIELVRHGIFDRKSGLAKGDVPADAMEISRGIIGTASKFFQAATRFAIARGAACIEWEDLDMAIEKWAIPLKFISDNPMRRDRPALRQVRG